MAKLGVFLFLAAFFIVRLRTSNATLLIGALFSNNNSLELNEETVFKHAVYISNQFKFSFINAPPNYPTLMHKSIHINKAEQLKTIKRVCRETKGNMIAIIGPHDDELKVYVKSMCHNLDIMHFDLEPSTQASQSFNMHPALDVLCIGYADLIRRFGWKNVAIFYDTHSNLDKVRCLLGGPAQDIPKLEINLKLASGDWRLILRDINRRRIKNIILDMQPQTTQVVLKMALQLGMINSSFHFILTTLDIESMDLEEFKYNKANITAFGLVKSNSHFYRSLAMNLSDYYQINSRDVEKTNVLLQAKNALLFDSIFVISSAIKEAEKSINLNNGNVSCAGGNGLTYGKILSTFADEAEVDGLTGPISFENRQRRNFELDVFQLKESGLFRSGTWSPKNRLNFTYYDEVFEEDISSAKKATYRVVTLVEEPYVMEEDGQFKGFCIDVLNEIANKMNFKYTIYKVPDGQYGSENENGSWNGMIRELMDKRADLAISALTINFKRQQVVDFTKPFMSLGISIIYKLPTSKKPGLFSFLNPLSLEIWLCTLATYIAVSLVMMVLARFSPYEWRSSHPCNSDYEFVENNFTMWNSLCFAIGTFLKRGSDINPKAISTRLVGGVWWFFTLIIISSYTANLAAFLTVEKLVMPIHNVEDLANQSKISYGCFKGGSTMNFFKDSRIDTYKRMWNAMQSNPEASFVTSNKEGVDRVLSKDYAYLMESTFIDYAVQRNCNLTQIGGLLDSKGYGIAAQLGSPYTDDISLRILQMQEKGEIQKFYNRWWKGGGTCVRDEKKDSKASPLNIENVGGIFVVLVIGVILALIVSQFEFAHYAKKNAAIINKPLMTQMADELRFAVQCCGSSKKYDITVVGAVPKSLPAPTSVESKNIQRLANTQPENYLPAYTGSASNIKVYDDEALEDITPLEQQPARTRPGLAYKPSKEAEVPRDDEDLKVLLKAPAHPNPPPPGWRRGLLESTGYDQNESSEESQVAVSAVASFRQHVRAQNPTRHQAPVRQRQHENMKMARKKASRGGDESEQDDWYEPTSHLVHQGFHQQNLYHRGRANPVTSSEVDYSFEEDEATSGGPAAAAAASQPRYLPIQQEPSRSRTKSSEVAGRNRSHSNGGGHKSAKNETGAKAGKNGLSSASGELEVEEEYEKETINYERFVKKSSIKKTA